MNSILLDQRSPTRKGRILALNLDGPKRISGRNSQ